MTFAVVTLCSFPGCSELVNNGRCAEHRRALSKEYRQVRGSSWSQGYDWEWKKARDKALARDHYLCQRCLKNDDRMIPATEVDHIIPFNKKNPKRDPLRLAQSNLQSLCSECHSRKTATVDGGFGRAKKG